MEMSQCSNVISDIYDDDILQKDLLISNLNQAQKFMLGNIDNIPEGHPDTINLKLPFTIITIEGISLATDGMYVKNFFLVVDRGDTVSIVPFQFSNTLKRWFCVGIGGNIDKETLDYRSFVDPQQLEYMSQETKLRYLHYSFTVLVRFLAAIACNNVFTEKITPSQKLQKKRKKKKKLPFFSYYILKIKTSKNYKNRGSGGIHASPRVHLRRGHIRRLDRYRTTWVQPCVVGDKSKGMVTKDYRMF
jgi:hypothetical protein